MQFQSAIAALGRWRELPEQERRDVCESIIAHFESASDVISAISELAIGLASSGERWQWPPDVGPTSDAPSTGGVGSLTTLLCPYLLAAIGCFVPKVSVPGSTAGAIDVLSLIPGFRSRLSHGEMLASLRAARIGHSSNTPLLAPADGYLFTLRESLGKKSVPPLVIASLLAKKLAVSVASAAVDVRCGPRGNLGKDHASCERNARLFVHAGKKVGLAITCVVTEVSEPRIPLLGRSESLFLLTQVLRARTVAALDPIVARHVETNFTLASEAAVASQIVRDRAEARRRIGRALFNGDAEHAFAAHIKAQGADFAGVERLVESYSLMRSVPLMAGVNGYVAGVDGQAIADALRDANRAIPGENDRMGARILASVGSLVDASDSILELRIRDGVSAAEVDEALVKVRRAFRLSGSCPAPGSDEVIQVIRDMEGFDG